MRIGFKQIILMLATLAIYISFLGQGCSEFKSAQSDSSASSAQTSHLDQDFIPMPETKTASIAYARQILDSMLACTGVGLADDKIRSEYNNRKGSLSEYGYATEVSGPMLMSITAVAGEVCSKLVESEMNSTPEQRRIFKSVDFAHGTASLSTGHIKDSVRRMARSCWQRDETEDEAQIIINTLDEAFSSSTEASSTSKAMLMICTGMLSSISSVSM